MGSAARGRVVVARRGGPHLRPTAHDVRARVPAQCTAVDPTLDPRWRADRSRRGDCAARGDHGGTPRDHAVRQRVLHRAGRRPRHARPLGHPGRRRARRPRRQRTPLAAPPPGRPSTPSDPSGDGPHGDPGGPVDRNAGHRRPALLAVVEFGSDHPGPDSSRQPERLPVRHRRRTRLLGGPLGGVPPPRAVRRRQSHRGTRVAARCVDRAPGLARHGRDDTDSADDARRSVRHLDPRPIHDLGDDRDPAVRGLGDHESARWPAPRHRRRLVRQDPDPGLRHRRRSRRPSPRACSPRRSRPIARSSPGRSIPLRSAAS